MPENYMTLDWADTGWRARRGELDRLVAFDPEAWAASPGQLAPGAIASFRTLAGQGEYGAWWPDACGGTEPGVRRFLLRTPAAHWERPWEGTIAALDPPRWPDVSLVRAVEAAKAIPERPTLDGALRILLVNGAAEANGFPKLDLDLEAQQLEAARAGLDAAARARVDPIVRRAPGAADLAATIAETQPNVLWFSGHGRADPPGLLMADGVWLSPDDLAGAVRAAAAKGADVRYLMLWACRTASPARFAAPRAAPPFIQAVSELGVSAVLATQAPLIDAVAQQLTPAIFSSLAAGQPLDHAVARARGDLMRRLGPEADDWACPVVWAIDLPPPCLELSAGAHAALRQDLAHRLLPPGWSLDPPDEAAARQGAQWADLRVWVQASPPESFAVQRAWLSRSLAAQTATAKAMLALDLADLPAPQALRTWAAHIVQTVSHPEDPTRRLRLAADRIQTDAEAGWRDLCADDLFGLALTAPSEAPPWFWQALASAKAAVVLAGDFPPARAEEGWATDVVGAKAVELTDGAPLEPELAAFAVLGAPADRIDVEAVAPGRLDGWIAAGLVVETQSGCLMPLSNALALAVQIKDELRERAHQVAFRYLDGKGAVAKLAESPADLLRRARFAHARATGDPAPLVNAADALMRQYRYDRRWVALRGVFEQVAGLHRKFVDKTLIVSAAQAFLETGAPDQALDWLELVRPDELPAAWAAHHALVSAEAAKSVGDDGSRERARTILEGALNDLAAEPGLEAERLEIRHDLARLTHFVDHDPATAITLYKRIELEWRELPQSVPHRVIALRNLAEAEMQVGAAAGAAGADQLDQAEIQIRTARSLMPLNWGASVVSELEYLAGRLALRQGRSPDEIASRFRRCRTRALETNHLMMAAIVEARLFWLTEADASPAFDGGAWARRRETLLPYARHTWAARVILNGDLRAAWRHVAAEHPRPAVAALRRAKALLDANTRFDRGEDQRRIGFTYAGLALFEPGSDAWAQFNAQFAWAPARLAGRDTAQVVWDGGPP